MDQISKMDDRIATAKVQMTDRDKTKDVALGTSKINYIVSWQNQIVLWKQLIFRTLVSLWLGQRSLTCLWNDCSPRLCEKSFPGLKRRQMQIGCSRLLGCWDERDERVERHEYDACTISTGMI